MQLFIRNLPENTTWTTLSQHFASHNPTKVVIPKDKRIAYIHFADESAAQVALADPAISTFAGKSLEIQLKENPKLSVPAVQAPEVAATPVTGNKSPYRLKPRKSTEPTKPKSHASLLPESYDISFKVTWKALTPVAANPCKEGGKTFPENTEEKKYQGFDNRWLTIDNKLALSPFTVKSAIANGFAAIMGGCYRVIRKKVEGHPKEFKDGTYPYNGEWKRYRVEMGNSAPGILRGKIDFEEGYVSIEPVTEYYYDKSDKSGTTPNADKEVFIKGNKYYVKATKTNNKLIIELPPKAEPFDDWKEVIYFGAYEFGMDNSLKAGEFEKKHYHRFYKEITLNEDAWLTGRVNPINLKPLQDQMKKVDMGRFKKFGKTADFDKREKLDGLPWYQDLTDSPAGIQEGDWIYFQAFEDEDGKKRITAIGKNFQFKTVFQHKDTVPEGQSACNSIGSTCPRCSLFGLTDTTDDQALSVKGFKGRFKSSALVSVIELAAKPVLEDYSVPVKVGPNKHAKVLSWKDRNGDECARQILLPIQGAPKPNKRDEKEKINYMNGMIRGLRNYIHAGLTIENLKKDITNVVDRYRNLLEVYGSDIQGENSRKNYQKMEYSHDLRSFAHVCKEGMEFSGNIGAQNCSAKEAAALIFLLEHAKSGHGFKIGLGKALELGSMTSRINGIMIRKSADYRWRKYQNYHEVTDSFEDIKKELNVIETEETKNSLNQTAGCEDNKSTYPPPLNYWRLFSQRLLG